MIQITSDEDFSKVAAEASERIQAMNDYISENYMGDIRIDKGILNFPRRYLMTVSEVENYYSFILDKHKRKNVSYTVLLIQTLEWTLYRTDVGLTARSMLCKLLITLRGSIAELLLIETAGETNSLNSFAKRAKRLADTGVIDKSLEEELKWLWEMRCRIHLNKLDFAEHMIYSDTEATRAQRAVVGLRSALKENARSREEDISEMV